MSEKNNINEFDLMMKSILDEAQEEVPAHVWEGISAGLDKAARRKAVVLWWKSAAVGAAAAAAVVLGVFLTYNDGSGLVPEVSGNDMIAVVEPAAEVHEETMGTEAEMPVMMAEADESSYKSAAAPSGDIVPESAAEVIKMTEDTGSQVVENEDKTVENEPVAVVKKEDAVEDVPSAVGYEKAEYFPTEWEDEKDVRKKRNVSLVLSGVAGTNNALNQQKVGPMMSSGIKPAPKKSKVEETSTKSSYGIPLSFGAGVKIDLSRRWSIGAGLNYTFLSRQFYGKYTKVSPEGDIESVTSSDIRNNQHYIGIPINAFFDIINNDKIDFYAYAGGTVEKCVSDSYSLLNTSINHKEKVAGVQLSANAGIGVEFMLGRHLGLYIDPSVRYYFKNRSQPKSIRTVQPLMLGFEMGLRVKL